MSMFSMASSSVQSGRAVACANGYRLMTSRSMVLMPCSASAAMCAGTSRRASRPPWMRGCSVLTRPSSISGKPVTSATSVTGRPASASRRAVPPVDSSLTPRACSAWAKSTMPVLSDTDSNAVVMVNASGERKGGDQLLDQLVIQELAAQRVAVDAQPFGGLALVALGMLHNHLEHRALDRAHHHVVHGVRLGAAQVLEILLQAVADAVFDLFLAHAWRAIWSSLAALVSAAGGSSRCVVASWSK